MMYQKLLKSMGGEKPDSIHAASYVGIEFMSKMALLLMVFYILKFISAYAAAVAVFGLAFLTKDKALTPYVISENSDSFETLLHYLIVTMSLLFLIVEVWM
ncbi:MAG: hypothetical protein KKD39_07455 [Candidatus Altiarchaeota archaeon]|nr:hypothetical protein [Candidatus Altiarchaeota archaeon]